MDLEVQLTSQEKNNLSPEEVAMVRALLQSYPIHNHDGRNSLEVATNKIRKAIDAYNIVIPTSAIAGENLSDGDAVRIGTQNYYLPSFDNNRVLISQTDYTGGEVTADSTFVVVAQSWKYSGNLSQQLYKMVFIGRGSYLGNTGRCFMAICKDNNGKPGSAIATYDLFYAESGNSINIGGSTYYYQTVKNINITIQPDTTYWFVFYNYCPGLAPYLYNKLRYSNGDKFSGGVLLYSNQESTYDWTQYTTWNTINGDLYMVLYFADTAGRIYKASSESQAMIDRYLGICNGNFSVGSTPSIISKGMKSNYTNLTGGDVYYLTNIPGQISTSFSTGKTWQAGKQYYAGDIVYYNGSFWVCRYSHFSRSSAGFEDNYWDYYIPKPVAIALDKKNLFII